MNNVALVTGASGGIGGAVALELAGAGFSVFITGRRLEGLEQVADKVRASGGVVHVATADLTAPKSVENLFEHVLKAFGRLDVLINNAGAFMPSTSIEDVALEDWNDLLAANLTSAFLCTQRAFRIMKGQQPSGGRIINNGSISAQCPRPFASAYTASKHGLTGLTKATALEGRPYRIACGQIDIGNANTALTEEMAHGVPQADGELRTEPTFDVDDVARAIGQMACLPLGANILSLTIMATEMPFIGRG